MSVPAAFTLLEEGFLAGCAAQPARVPKVTSRKKPVLNMAMSNSGLAAQKVVDVCLLGVATSAPHRGALSTAKCDIPRDAQSAIRLRPDPPE